MGSALTLSTGVITVSEGAAISSSRVEVATSSSLTLALTAFSTVLSTNAVA